jgi:hypothetical protein
MVNNKLYTYYNNIDSRLMFEVVEDKKINTYKITSKLLFNLEVELMENVIKKLNALKIYPIYIYDALMANENDIEIITKIMNETALEMNIFTSAENNKK